MSVMTPVGRPTTAVDDIRVFLPTIGDDEYEQRRRMRAARNIATAKIAELEPGHAMQLCWMVVEVVTGWLYAPAPIEQLVEVAEQCRRLLIVADTAGRLEGQE